MYDELVKRLRNRRICIQQSGSLDDFPLLREAADAIEELTDMIVGKWIPVTERLPEFEGAVLCMRKSNVYGVRPHQEILYVDEYGFKNYDDIYLADGVVTHWMPLPSTEGLNEA